MYNILYVDDEPILLSATKQFLERDPEFHVGTEASATGALALLPSAGYDAIISDYQMPGTDGIAFLKQVRSSGNHIPFILFTGKGREEIVIQALNAGADFYLQKSGDPGSQYTQLAQHVRMAVDRNRAEAALKESRERLSTILNAAQVGMILVDADSHTIIQANPKALALIGAPENEVVGTVCHQFICPADPGNCPVTDLGQAINASERVLIARSGAHIPILKTVVSTRIGTKSVLVESFLDITDLKKSENALRESEEKYRRLAENARDMIYRMSLPDGVYRYVSPAAKQITGHLPEEFYANPQLVKKLVHPEWLEYFEREWDSLIRGEIKPFYEFAITDGNGMVRWLNQRNVLVRDEEGKPTAVEGIVTDITSHRQTEEALRKVNGKLKLLAGITRHDINNQLTMLNGFLDLVALRNPDQHSGEEFLKVKSVAGRIASMVQFMREYEEIGVNSPAWHDSRLLIDSAARQIPLGSIVIKNEIPAGTEIFADPLITRVWYNLLDNALRYGRKITTIRFFLQESDGRVALICEDDGDGVPEGDKTRIFERGFGKNTGMGLFLAAEILSITGIGIRETGMPGKGARFEMTVPPGSFRRCPKATSPGAVGQVSAPVPAPGK